LIVGAGHKGKTVDRKVAAEKKHLAVALVSRQRAPQLRELIENLSQQAKDLTPDTALSLCVVLDQPADDAYAAVLAAPAGLPVEWRALGEVGPPAARNALVAWMLERAPEAFVFLDDDELPAPDWLARLLELWERYPETILTGPLIAVSTRPSFLLRHGLFHRLRPLRSGEMADSAYIHNTLVPLAVARRLGPSFDLRLTAVGGSDAEWFGRARAAGFPIRYFPELAVHEVLRPEDQRLCPVARRWIGNGRAAALARRLRRPGPRTWLRLAGEGLARVGYGFFALLGRALLLQAAAALRGLRVMLSGVGMLLGLFSRAPRRYQG